MKLILVAVLLIGAAAPLQAQDGAFSATPGARLDGASVTTARELYASARYEEALAILNGMLGGERLAVADLKVIEQYRSLCLLALGRGEEAEAAIASVITADPFYQPGEDEASPRVRSTFADVRKRLLPGLTTARYSAAKLAYDRKEFADAQRQFKELVTLLDDPQMTGRPGDLRVLAGGFLDLATAAAAPPPEPKRAEAPPPPPAAPVPAAAAAPRVYSAEDGGVIPPVTVRQDLPPVPASITASVRPRGLLDIVIDEQGRVMAMTLRTRVHPVYDSLLLNAVRDWKYKPAIMNGRPVQFRKLIQFSVQKP